MKKILVFAVLIFLAAIVHAQTLNSAIEEAANEISERLPERTTVVVINFQSDSERLTDYVIDELNGKIANIGKIRPVERRLLNELRSELNFNMSGEVSDESAQNIGRMLGSRYIILGSIDFIGSQYRIRFRAITTETASIEYSFFQNIRNDAVLESLLRGTGALADFTSEERIRASALNLFFGLGSFTVQKDYIGGGITAAFEGVGTVLLVYSIAMYNSKMKYGEYWQETTLTTSFEAYPFFAGLGLYLGGAIFGIIKAQIYSKPGSRIAVSPIDRLQLNLVSHNNENTGLQIKYKWSF